MFGQIGVVNEGVAVALISAYGFVAVYFFLADRVLAMPFEKQTDGPGIEYRIAVLVEHGSGFGSVLGGDAVVVGRGHIEIGTREVTFVFINGLKHSAGIAGEG